MGDRFGASPRLARAIELADLAWRDLPAAHRALLESVGASQYRVVDRPLGAVANDMLCSAGERCLSNRLREELDIAVGVWVPALRVVLVNAHHHALDGLDENSFEAMIVRTAWHEWGHALSVSRATAADVAAGADLVKLAPHGIAEFIRSGQYRRNEYTHELIADTYALLMGRRRRGQRGRPPWLAEEIYNLVRRVTGWTD